MDKTSSIGLTNSKVIKRLYVNQFVMAIFSVMVLFASAHSDTLLMLASLLSIGIYMFLTYNLMWEAGAKAASKHMVVNASNEDIKKAIILVLKGSILNFIGATAYLISKVYLISQNVTTNAEDNIGIFIGTIIWTVIRFINAMYLGIEVLLFPNPNTGLPLDEATIEFAPLLTPPYYFFIIILPMIITGICAYMLGASEYSIMEKLGFKRKK